MATWTFQPSRLSAFLPSLSDRNPTRPLERTFQHLLNLKKKVSVIVILRGHLNPMKKWAFPFPCRLSDRNPTWPLEPNKQLIISMDLSLSDRNPMWPLEHARAIQPEKQRSLSDRNPTWPLEPSWVYTGTCYYSLSDRNPTWPLELLIVGIAFEQIESQWS